MLLLDSSVWIDYFQAAGTPAHIQVRTLLGQQAEVVTTEPVIMELLAGADTPARYGAVERLTNGLPVLSVDPRLDFRQAAAIYLTVRRSGRTPRSMIDCLIAAVALRHDVELLHNNVDFDAIAACWPLRARALR